MSWADDAVTEFEALTRMLPDGTTIRRVAPPKSGVTGWVVEIGDEFRAGPVQDTDNAIKPLNVCLAGAIRAAITKGA